MNRLLLPLLFLTLVVPSASEAKTITLTPVDCDKMAVISSETPRLSWSTAKMGPGIFATYSQVYFYPHVGILFQFNLDKIPKGQRITKAEFTLPASYVAGTKPEVGVRRLVTEWGNGVCHDYRLTFPKKIPWAQPGGRGITTDRANQMTGMFRIDKAGKFQIDVTQDIELWYTGAEPNFGWILTLEGNQGIIYAPYPHMYGEEWKLQITFEPR